MCYIPHKHLQFRYMHHFWKTGLQWCFSMMLGLCVISVIYNCTCWFCQSKSQRFLLFSSCSGPAQMSSWIFCHDLVWNCWTSVIPLLQMFSSDDRTELNMDTDKVTSVSHTSCWAVSVTTTASTGQHWSSPQHFCFHPAPLTSAWHLGLYPLSASDLCVIQYSITL